MSANKPVISAETEAQKPRATSSTASLFAQLNIVSEKALNPALALLQKSISLHPLEGLKAAPIKPMLSSSAAKKIPEIEEPAPDTPTLKAMKSGGR